MYNFLNLLSKLNIDMFNSIIDIIIVLINVTIIIMNPLLVIGAFFTTHIYLTYKSNFLNLFSKLNI